MRPVSTLVFLAGSIARPYEPNNTFLPLSFCLPRTHALGRSVICIQVAFFLSRLVMEYDDSERQRYLELWATRAIYDRDAKEA